MTLPAWIALGLLLAALVVAGLGALRLRALSRRVGSFECGLRTAGAESASWTLGIAHYGVGRIDWWRSWSLSWRPGRTWSRHDLVIVGREPFGGADARPDSYLVRCRYREQELELTMARAAYEGLASWLEAAPPGRRDVVV
ncbi:DUF2550 domain-containing protein [Cellulosimicrobium sp. CUA-896]|uniref:DUF2550 domain-containing protein n=1 Tax=Cellulosimicrobium sp. CUA-896 TaxID=1517881 RepID=UPI00095A007B|nr:DUF2550 domain-containing protein [Cellulosimicrobium sp. CUA-896]OLT45524.1 hypothetical protein BJF88_05630 [Cellulosimicrobium sp. CUA-896]